MSDLRKNMRRLLGEERPSTAEVRVLLADAKIEAEVKEDSERGRTKIYLEESPRLQDIQKIAKILGVPDFEIRATSNHGIVLRV